MQPKKGRSKATEALAKVNEAVEGVQKMFTIRTNLYEALVSISKRVAFLQHTRNRQENRLYKDIVSRLDKLETIIRESEK